MRDKYDLDLAKRLLEERAIAKRAQREALFIIAAVFVGMAFIFYIMFKAFVS